ncbi:uncharacterized protein LOC123529501 [Mercenaria mercenaria]|uniref:uncharacterized protein LOC123529501 n=1 Tax=Mercenaria mercenaria TaxID=6596 RepID=UPI001E1E160B|nr:uncharacterized protein LOC123529501 [Mercenaria mercenaria]XP_045165793.1 uncharacterized protein LOC123529501 [Mercenaria mercenaria]
MAKTTEESLLNNPGGGRRFFGPYMFTFGLTDQFALDGPFRGRQCTSMALAAIIVWVQKGKPCLLTPEQLNTILVEGNRLHSRLRVDQKLSAECDGMIAVYDIPSSRYLEVGEVCGVPTKVKLAQESFPVFTTRRRDLDFPTVGEFVAAYNPRMSMGFLVTIDSFTYAIIRRVDNTVLLFDSHGHLQVLGHLLGKRAGILLCQDIHHMELVLVGMYGAMAPCDIAPVNISLPDGGLKHIQEPAGVEEQSPYISAFWGRDD